MLHVVDEYSSKALRVLAIAMGKFELGGIPPAPRGQPQIEVTVEIDSKGSDEQKAIAQATCLQTAADHESTVAARKRN